MRTLFLHPPSFDGFDGGAGARYQAKREVRSFWYPTWLAQPAAMVDGSRLLDAPADGLGMQDVLPLAREYDLVIMHTSSPSFPKDARVAELLKAENPRLMIGMVGAKVAVDPEGSLKASAAIDFVARDEFDYTCKEVAEGRALESIKGLSFRAPDGAIRHNEARPLIADMDELPWVAPRSTSATCASRIISSATCSIHTYRSIRGGDAGRSARSACGRRRSADTNTACAARKT